LNRQHIPVVLLTSRTRAEIEPLRRDLQHSHPFITESGGGIFFPDGYFNVRIPGAERAGRYLRVALGSPYKEVIATLDEVAEETGAGVTGFHHMSAREIAENTGLPPRASEYARDREFDEPFFFTSADGPAIERFVAAASRRGFSARPGGTFWHFSSGCDAPKAVRSLTKLFRDATRTRLRAVGIGSGKEDLPWLRAVDQGILLRAGPEVESAVLERTLGTNISLGDGRGPAGWNTAILNAIS
jgi:mannosyl-3-phosphoglycerate phosphatase